MKVLKMYRSRKYLQRLLLSNILLVVLFLLLFSLILYAYFRNTAMELQQEASKKVLNQVNYNIDNLNEMVRNFTMTTFFDRDVSVLMSTRDLDIFELSNKLRRLEDFVTTNPYVYSILAYNAYNGCYYSSQYPAVACGESGPNNAMSPWLQQEQMAPKLTLIPSNTLMSGGVDQLFSIFMHDYTDTPISKRSILMVNIKSAWLFDNIKKMNELTDDSSLFIVDANGNIFRPHEQTAIGEQAGQALIAQIKEDGGSSDHLIIDTDSGKKIVTYLTSNVNNWKIVSVQPYDSVFGKINKIGTFSILVLLCFVLASIVVTSAITLKLYRPIGSLISLIRREPRHEGELPMEDKDEISYISSVYQQYKGEISQLRGSSNDRNNVIKNYQLRRIVTESSTLLQAELQSHIEAHQLQINFDGAYRLILFQIDSYREIKESKQDADIMLYKLAISNIAEEILSRKFMSQAVDLLTDHIAVLISPERSDGEHFYKECEPLLREIQQVFHSYYKVSLTVSLSEPIPHLNEISRHYEQVLENAKYRMIYGKMSILTPDLIQENVVEKDDQVPPELERKLVTAIKSGNLNEMEQHLAAIFKYISSLKYDDIVYAVLHLTVTINHAVREINSNHLEPITIDLKAYNQKLLEKDTLDEVFLLMMNLLCEITDQRKTLKRDRNEFLIVAIKEIVKENYMDLNLSVQSIASLMRMSSAYVGRIFKKSESITIADYIQEIRLQHTMELLEKKLSIAEVMEKAGFGNESHFFKVFKRKTGTTPKEYRTKKSL